MFVCVIAHTALSCMFNLRACDLRARPPGVQFNRQLLDLERNTYLPPLQQLAEKKHTPTGSSIMSFISFTNGISETRYLVGKSQHAAFRIIAYTSAHGDSFTWCIHTVQVRCWSSVSGWPAGPRCNRTGSAAHCEFCVTFQHIVNGQE